jgi:phosphate-selective porin
VPSGSPLGGFQYKGTYTVNLNCTGTMTLGPAASASSTTTTTTTSSAALTVNFVLTPPITYPTTNAYSASPSGNASRPGIEFTLTSAGETLAGFGIAQ